MDHKTLIDEVLASFLLPAEFDLSEVKISSLCSGLIHSTWKCEFTASTSYVLQQMNANVFTEPALVCNNINLVSKYLKSAAPTYLSIDLVPTRSGELLLKKNSSNPLYFRLFRFINDSVVYQTVNSEEIAYQAAKQFGKFANLLSGMNSEELHVTLQNFHNLSFRYDEFDAALTSIKNSSIDMNSLGHERMVEVHDHIQYLQSLKADIVDAFEVIQSQGDSILKKRVMHHDTKISNVLFNRVNEGICVIDLDTLMPGYFISDVGDMMRTYLCPVDENEPDFSKISIRNNYFHAIVFSLCWEIYDLYAGTSFPNRLFEW